MFCESIKTEYEEVKVFRAVHRADCLDDDDFICNVEEAELYKWKIRGVRLQHYAISVNEDIEQLIKAVRFPNARHPWLGIAEGFMKKEYGPADFIEDNTHHNWYLFQEAIPKQKWEFKLINPINI